MTAEMQRPPRVKIDRRMVALSWTPPDGLKHPVSKLVGFDPGLAPFWCTFAFWTLRGATDFVWKKQGCKPCSVEITPDQAWAILNRRGMNGQPMGNTWIKALAEHGIVQQVAA